MQGIAVLLKHCSDDIRCQILICPGIDENLPIS